MTAIQQSGYRENLLFCTLGIFEGFSSASLFSCCGATNPLTGAATENSLAKVRRLRLFFMV